MIEKKGSSAQVLERLMSSYGVATQKDLAAALDIPANNISGWTQRDRVPGNAIIKCALDTGSDLQWLVTGDVANANYTRLPRVPQGEALYKEISSNGGKPVLRRIMDAYGFTFQKQLCELLGISSATVSTWVRRNYFPGDIVLTCAIDTGVSLEWLATGRNEHKKNLGHEREAYALPRKDLVAGVLKDTGTWSIDLSFISQKINSPTMVVSKSSSWIVDMGVVSISNGRWLLGIDNKFDIYDVTVMPGKKINVINNGNGFICDIDEVQVTAKVILTIEYD